MQPRKHRKKHLVDRPLLTKVSNISYYDAVYRDIPSAFNLVCPLGKMPQPVETSEKSLYEFSSFIIARDKISNFSASVGSVNVSS